MLKPVEKIKAYAVRQPRRALSMVSAKLMLRSQGFDSPLTDSFASYPATGLIHSPHTFRAAGP